MAIEAVTPNPATVPTAPADAPSSTSSNTSASDATKKVDPNSEKEVLNAAVEAFLPSMVSNTLMLNNTLFNFAKDAIDEGDQE
ncbi:MULTISPECIES: hypothetical protein [Rhizobium]|uniref:Uncharacterized protein n=1 Tax=Rhizobium leguminosarum TaxID=384 RepID=A0A1B1CL90_RHILE|nr:hypothetical protein [Rhizobium leguminosarum]ANP90533.1 hypothetical protein BA011_31880 [Rhizobium leguminosarum]API56749.1 hypothetical protein BMW22_35500 [Rhizobium leguminosarum]TAU13139.1 hypothetical protein ELI50_36540 [Rhizobium leguminosarum]